MCSSGWALIQPDWCPYKKRKLDIQVQKGDQVRMQQGDGRCKPRRGFRGSPACPSWPWASSPELWQNHILLLFMSRPVHDHCYSRLSTLRQKWRWSCWTYFQEWKQKENGMEYIDNCASWSSLPPRIETKHEKRKNNLFLMILMLYQFTLIYLLSFTLDWRKLYSYCH